MSEGPSQFLDPKYVRFLQMKLFGEPLEKIKEQAAAAGLDPSYLDQDFPDYRLDPDYKYYLDEMQHGTAIDVLKEKMLERGLDPTVLDVYDIGMRDTVRVDYAKYIKWFTMKEQGGDLALIRLKMEQEGLDSSYLDRDTKNIEFYNIPYDLVVNSFRTEKEPEKKGPIPEVPKEGVCNHKYVRHVDYAYYKKFKLLKMHFPIEQVKQKMETEGLDPSILDLDMNTLAFDNIPEDTVVRYDDGHYEPCWKPDPDAEPAPKAPKEGVCNHKYARHVDYAYYKKFKLLKMHFPIEQVKQKMETEGLDPSILDLDMNTLAFDNIPEDTVVRYDDGHYEPCWKPDPDVETTSNPSKEPAKKPKPAPTPNPPPVNKDNRDPRPPLSSGLKLRPLYWDVNNSESLIRNSMWDKMNDREIKIDQDMMKREFQAKTSTVTFAMPTSQSEKVTTLLEGQREQNVGIVIGRIRLDVQDIRHALLFVDFNVLTRELVIRLASAIPTTSEQEAFLGYTGDVNKLSKASQFGYYLSDIPNLQARVNCFKVILSFDDELERLKSSLQKYFDVIRMVRNNKGLYTIIEIILALGNFLNGDNPRGGAWGFHIGFLQKLNETKTADNKKTLMT